MFGKIHPKNDFKKYFIISDLHSVFVDLKAFKCFLAAYTEHEADALFINGDLLDCQMMMGLDKQKLDTNKLRPNGCDPNDLLTEIDFTYEKLLTPLRHAHKKTPIIFKPGNHEDRLIRIGMGNLSGLQQLTRTALSKDRIKFESLMRFDDLNITMSRGEKRNGHPTDIDFLQQRGDRAAILHGHLTSKSRLKIYLTHFLCSGTSGHTHQMMSEKMPWYGGVHIWQESGCLCQTTAVGYQPIGKDPGWQHGFVTIWVHKHTGQIFVKGHEIKNYALEFHGQIFKA